MIAVEYGESKAYVYADQVSIEYAAGTGYTNEEIENIKAEEEEQRRQAEEAEREAARKAEEERAARIEAAMTDVGVSYNPTMEASAEEVWLLACVIDWESGWEPYEGKLAVANVVLNRVRNSRYDNTITGVIYARSQFSGVSDGCKFNISGKTRCRSKNTGVSGSSNGSIVRCEQYRLIYIIQISFNCKL